MKRRDFIKATGTVVGGLALRANSVKGPTCKICRREGVKLFLKGVKCETKCPIDKR